MSTRPVAVVVLLLMVPFALPLSQGTSSVQTSPSRNCLYTQFSTLSPIANASFAKAGDLDGWQLLGQNYNTSFVPYVPEDSLDGSLSVNATIVPGKLTVGGYGNGSVWGDLLPGGQLFFSMSRQFQWTNGTPTFFSISSWTEPLGMVNVSTIYIDYIVSTPGLISLWGTSSQPHSDQESNSETTRSVRGSRAWLDPTSCMIQAFQA